MIDITCEIWAWTSILTKNRQVTMLCTIPSDSNTHNITLYCEFSNALLGHATRTLPGMNEKTQSFIFTSGSRRLPAPCSLEINMEIDVLFSYFHAHTSDLTMACKGLDIPFEWGINIDMYYRRKFLFDQQMLLKSFWYFPKKDFKPKICIRAWRGHRSKHVLASCL